MPKRAPKRFLVATEACGGGTPDLFCSPKVLGYMDLYRRKKSVGGASRGPRGWRARPGGGRGTCLVDSPETPHDVRPTPKIPINNETYRKEPRSGVLPPQASIATKNQSGPCSGTLPEGGSLTGGHLHHRGALHDKEGVVHPQG